MFNSISILLTCEFHDVIISNHYFPYINIGSLNDPKDLPGLAHFCEHMLFMGTKKYPRENEFAQFVTQNGGCNNAYTAIDHTNYYCSSKTDALKPLLERFINSC